MSPAVLTVSARTMTSASTRDWPDCSEILRRISARMPQRSNRASDQQSARQALALMRLDIHCALSAQTPSAIVDGFGNTTGYLLTLPQPNPDCPGVQQSGNAAVQWCTVKISATRYKLYRSI